MIFRKLTLSRKKTRGFSIAEVLLAAFVLTVGLLATESLITFSYKSSGDSQDLIVASELAQEGVELARNVRDNNLVYREDHKASDCQSSMNGQCDPFNGFSPGNNKKCLISYADTTLDCGGNPDPALALSGNFYQHTGSGRFYRLLKTDMSGNGTDTNVRIRSFVTWQDPGNHLNGGGDVAWCTILNKCVYTELFLTAWK